MSVLILTGASEDADTSTAAVRVETNGVLGTCTATTPRSTLVYVYRQTHTHTHTHTRVQQCYHIDCCVHTHVYSHTGVLRYPQRCALRCITHAGVLTYIGGFM